MMQAKRDTKTERNKVLMASGKFFAPKACAVSPLVPMRRNPKFQ